MIIFAKIIFIFGVGFDEAKTHLHTIRCKYVVVLSS